MDLERKLEVVRGILPRVHEGAAEHMSYGRHWQGSWAISVTTAIHGLCRSSADLDFVDERLEMLKKAVESGENVSRICFRSAVHVQVTDYGTCLP